mgnify:CR=1 FL=1
MRAFIIAALSLGAAIQTEHPRMEVIVPSSGPVYDI